MQFVNDEEKPFICFKCTAQFPTFAELTYHKDKSHQDKPKFLLNYKESPLEIVRKTTNCPTEMVNFVSDSIRQVPETTFNNMHGMLRDIGTQDGQIFMSKNGLMGAIEKVKMNVSETWTSKNVYESGTRIFQEKLHNTHAVTSAIFCLPINFRFAKLEKNTQF